MVEVWLPYGKTDVHISIPLRDLLGTAEPVRGEPVVNAVEEIQRSLKEPVNSRTLDELVRRGAKIAVAVDGTMIPHLAVSAIYGIVQTLRQVEVPLDDISIVVGNGLRGRSDPDLIKSIRSVEGFQSLRVVEHTPEGGNVTSVGVTTGGTEITVNSSYTDSDLRIAVGDVRPDHFSGVKGAQSTILPSLSQTAAIERCRSRAFNVEIVPGSIDGNPVHDDEMEAARLAKTDLAVNLVTNGQGELLKAFSGDLDASMREATSSLGESYRVKVEANADIFIVSAGGSRYDFDLYNSIWALEGVSSVARRGATIMLLSECTEGLGADGLETLAQIDTLNELRRRYMLGARAVHLIKTTLRKNEVVLVSALPSYLAEPLGLSVERTASEALRNLTQRRRRRRTQVVTHGCYTVPYVS